MTWNPYRLVGGALGSTDPIAVHFSGGRSSAYLLRQIQLAHGGAIPPEISVLFTNTGRERDETLDFVAEVGRVVGLHGQGARRRLARTGRVGGSACARPHSIPTIAAVTCRKEQEPAMTDADRIEAAIELAVRYGGIDGDHHKAWVIDSMVRMLAGDRYEQIVADAKDGEDGPETYDWDEGIAP